MSCYNLAAPQISELQFNKIVIRACQVATFQDCNKSKNLSWRCVWFDITYGTAASWRSLNMLKSLEIRGNSCPCPAVVRWLSNVAIIHASCLWFEMTQLHRWPLLPVICQSRKKCVHEMDAVIVVRTARYHFIKKFTFLPSLREARGSCVEKFVNVRCVSRNIPNWVLRGDLVYGTHSTFILVYP